MKQRIFSLILHKKSLALASAVILMLLVIKTLPKYNKPLYNRVPHAKQEKELWMTIFVHGSFATLLGLLNVTNVINDDVNNTLYYALSKKMRNDQQFYSDQPILEKGLKAIIPSFDPAICNHKILAAYPIIKSFDTILHQIKGNKEANLYYTFGWSGLMSQQRRRLAAIRLYNCITEERERIYRENNILPKIRLIAHSHGGNICLNLAAIDYVVAKRKNEAEKSIDFQKEDRKKSLQAIKTMIEAFPKKQQAKKERGASNMDYIPEAVFAHIDELILLGTPIQPETEGFLLFDLFSSVYNFYSEKDFIQQLDWISTRKFYSNQRINSSILNAISPTRQVIQVKLTYNDDLSSENKKNDSEKCESNDKRAPLQKDSSLKSIWQKIINGSIFSINTADPSHKELWFLSWHKEQQASLGFLFPLPVSILTPLFLEMLNKQIQKSCSDVDVNISSTSHQIIATVVQHETKKVLLQKTLPTSVITEIKNKIEPWRPKSVDVTSKFNKAYKHLISQLVLEKT